MRHLAVLSLPLLALTACGGGSDVVATLGSIAPPVATVTSGTATASTSTSFLDISTETVFDANGGLQSLTYDAKGRQLYQGNAGTPGSPSGSVDYSPRDGIFTLTLKDSSAGISRVLRYQDPAHRSTPDPYIEAQVPTLAGFNYLDAGQDGDRAIFFYERPGSTTAYVSLAGFEFSSNKTATGAETHDTIVEEQGAFVFGQRTVSAQVPRTGSGHFDGDFLATMVASADEGRLQWMSGTSSVDVDFGKSTLSLGLKGTVLPAFLNDTSVANIVTIPAGAAFAASGTAALDPTRTSFTGRFSSAGFTLGGQSVPVDFTSVNKTTNVAGASSIDGSFYGPNAVNVGGSFRITGGIPNQRVDILGAFTGVAK